MCLLLWNRKWACCRLRSSDEHFIAPWFSLMQMCSKIILPACVGLCFMAGNCCIHLNATRWVTVKSEFGICLVTDRKALNPISVLKKINKNKLPTQNTTWLNVPASINETESTGYVYEDTSSESLGPLDASICYHKNVAPQSVLIWKKNPL